MIAAARQWALDILSRVHSAGSYANLSLQDALRRAQLTDRDKALCTTIVYGTIQRRRSLDAILQTHAKRPLAKLEPPVLTILRMTAYQVLFLDKIPAYAALDDGVALCKRTHPKASGLVNAVIRSLLRDGRPADVRLAEITRNMSWADRTGITYSYPTWLVHKLENQVGRSRTGSVLAACNEAAHLSVRVNPLATTLDAVMASSPVGVDECTRSLLSPQGIRFERGFDVSSWAAWQEGFVSVQDEGAMLVALLLGVTKGERVLDLCAGPGGKTAHIAELQRDEGAVVACDIHSHKLRLVTETASRLGLHSVSTVEADGRRLPDQPGLRESFDSVLVDAPCSGFGVLRHRPEIRWERTEQDVTALSLLQSELLHSAIDLVKPGGVVLYATCTLLAEENDGVVRRVVSERSDVVEDDLTADLPAAVRDLAGRRRADGSGDCLLWPDLFGTDGFYMARLRKKENSHAAPV